MLSKNQFVTCIPLVSDNEEDLYREIDEALAQKPDYLEWRRDYFLEDDYDQERRILRKIRNLGVSLIYTFRDVKEGGFRHVLNEDRWKHIANAAKSNAVTYIDVELNSSEEYFEAVRQVVKSTQSRLMVSYHDFDKTGAYDEIISILDRMSEKGADAFKLALYARDKVDFKTASAAGGTYSLKTDKPMIMISMGEEGRLSRILPEVMGGCLTFASGVKATAPGQITLEDILKLRETLGL
ncbi:3-dehydroquinate dehydratase [Eubacterium maltosivorans]|uniref:type I 3-dehydroquinate dehydratase n=1 Tax=Eubacterium maltosivorans TaxID=2041044 RepID=UPI000883705C|nr:type I 3-dehydroquinate dehydratase [Eubacterium maltosivorans]WPK81634.1 3-dehydroquinate dehydratase [Eubacterium maltosivorans]SDP52922.1 3-dehydroquinate dehydratase [Eubacterium maltosivorans]